MRDVHTGILSNSVTKNKWIWGALSLCIILLLVAVYTPVISDVMSLLPPSPAMWGVILLMSFIPLMAGQALLALKKKMIKK